MADKTEQKPTHDAFGQPLEKKPFVPPEPEKPKGSVAPFDVASHPTVVEMNAKIQDMSHNLSEQGKLIKKRDERIRELEAARKDADKDGDGADGEFVPPNKDIKRSKDLTDDERDEMTANEIKLMDEKADALERENKAAEALYKAQAKKKDPEAGKEPKDGEDTPEKLLEAEIEALSGGDAERKRELKEAAALTNFAGLTTKEQIAERLKLGAEKFIPNYTPPKEQPTSKGAPVKTGGGANDPHNIDQIVREARSGSTGEYPL